MMEGEHLKEREEYSGKSAMQLMRELLRLIMVLIWRFLVWLFKRFLKGLLWCIEAIEKGWDRLNDWWHDNSTQEKVAKTKAWIKMAAKTFGRWCVIAGKATIKGIGIGARATWKGLVIAAKATGRGLVYAAKATIQGIIHLGPTLKKMGRGIVQGAKAFVAWIRRCRRGMKLSRIRRKRAYQEFKRNGGMKGAISRSSRNVRNNIERFMEEDQEEAAPDAVTEDDIMEEALEEGANDGKKSMKFGKSFISHAKNFMDVE
jgi:hypothetical protein